MGPSQSVTEYIVDFQQALTDLAGHVTDEQVKKKKYRAGLQHDLKQLCRASPTGARWARLQDPMQHATLQWPVVQERIATTFSLGCSQSALYSTGQRVSRVCTSKLSTSKGQNPTDQSQTGLAATTWARWIRSGSIR
jgi:hypothetical protein